MSHAAAYQDNFLGLGAGMRKPLIISSVFHVALFAFSIVGLPMIVPERIISDPVSVEIVDVSELTRTETVAKPSPKKEPPPKPEEPKPTPPKMAEETPPDLTMPEPPDLEPAEEAAEPIPPPPKEVVLKKPEPKPPPKPEVTKKEKPKSSTNDFQTLLKNLAPAEEVAQENAAIAPLADKLTMSEVDAIKRQLAGCWNVMAGAKYAEDLVVEVRVVVNRDRSVQQATILDQGRYNRDSHFRAAADSALRALRNPKCSPLALPEGKYNQWKTTIITFDPREML